ncbi:hypothetical protein AGR5A_Cc10032 [Agrobacterium genomosp. 5 str. CFBP 6626]|nr:hypothetical protein AGR5A_Cc10032 [Agrobacterium genomosp. 5 str. CFBP 6626]
MLRFQHGALNQGADAVGAIFLLLLARLKDFEPFVYADNEDFTLVNLGKSGGDSFKKAGFAFDAVCHKLLVVRWQIGY